MDAAELTAIYELRLDLESAVAALAAERRTQEDVDVMEHILRRLEAALCCAPRANTRNAKKDCPNKYIASTLRSSRPSHRRLSVNCRAFTRMGVEPSAPCHWRRA
ncbi:FCD domain-containing protein [Achromobacter denitrificans]|nr:FCD domain-containing protein [Achromobacter denitrificans]